MGCNCGKPKCDGKCGISPAVLQINNPSECVIFHKVDVPASMGDSTTNPPKTGAYKNVLLYYEADQTSWLYSSDGIPVRLTNGITNYEDAINLPQINGETLIGDKSSADLKLVDAPMVITIASGNITWSGADTAEDIYNFFLNQGKVNVVFEGSENYGYGIVSAAYIPGEQKMMCMVTVASVDTGSSPVEFSGNALYGLMTFYTAGKAVDVGELDLQLKLFVTDFTGLELNDNVLSGVPATNTYIGMVKPSDGLSVSSDGTLTVIDHVFDTVADMKASTELKNGDYAQTLGFHTLNDGGGAVYRIRTIANDDIVDESFIIALADDSLIAELIVGENIIPEQLGAYGDGTHDDTAVINKAIAYSNNTFKCIKATKKYLITSSIDAESITNGYINIDGETPVHSYMQSGIYGYNIGGSFIVNDIPLIAGNKTKVLRGSIRNLTIIPVTKNSSIDLFYKVKFSGFHFSNLSVFYFKNFLDDCLCNASSRIENCVIQFIESLIYAESFIESAIQNNYITGIANRGSSCFNTYLYGTKVEDNFIEYFAYVYNDQVNNRLLADHYSRNNIYDYFGTFFGKKADSTDLNYQALLSEQDTFSNWTGDHAIELLPTNINVKIKSPIVKPQAGHLSFMYNSTHINATAATYLEVDNIQNSMNANQPTLDFDFWTTNQQNKRIYVQNMDYISVDSLPSFGFIGQHVIYNDSLYCYIKSGSWKKISDQGA